ncbi:MAG: FecCD family ABC transporter permease, partial [Methylocella sp.]
LQFIPPDAAWGFPVVFAAAFAMGVLTILAVYRLAWSPAGLRLMSLLLAGVILNVIASSAILLFQYFSGLTATLRILHWLMGDLSVVGYSILWKTGVFAAVGAFALLMTAKPLNAVALGEETAVSMGVDVRSLERRIYFASSFLVAAVVATAGPIGFIGLVAPHLLRLLFGPDARIILPGSMLAGALLLLVADTAARTVIAPTEIPVGVFTSAFGGSFFLYLLWKTRRDLWA